MESVALKDKVPDLAVNVAFGNTIRPRNSRKAKEGPVIDDKNNNFEYDEDDECRKIYKPQNLSVHRKSSGLWVDKNKILSQKIDEGEELSDEEEHECTCKKHRSKKAKAMVSEFKNLDDSSDRGP